MTEFDRVVPEFEHLVFVYGTLTDPQRTRAVLPDESGTRSRAGTVGKDTERPGAPDEPFAFVGEATLSGLRRVEGTYPTLAPGDAVDGRLLTVDEVGLATLDAYEGVDRGLYVRVAVPLEAAEGGASEGGPEEGAGDGGPPVPTDRAWLYVCDPDRLGADATWPGSGSLETRIRRHLDRVDATVRRRDRRPPATGE